MSSLPPLAAIRVFEAAGRHEHFSRAAEELGMTQAAVSYQVRQLEEQIGRKLFDREHGRVRLTETGLRLLPAVSDAFGGLRQAFSDLGEENAGVLSVTVPVSYGTTWLSASIGRFQLKYPDLALRMALSNELVDLTRGEFDLAVRIGKGKWEGMRADFLFRLYLTPLCSPQFIEQNRIREPRDLLDVERLAPNDSQWADWFAAAGVGETPPPRRGIVLDNQAQEGSAAEAGFGVALMTPLYWKSELESGRLVQPFPQSHVLPIASWLVNPERRVGVRKIERFREWIREELSNSGDLIPKEALEPPE